MQIQSRIHAATTSSVAPRAQADSGPVDQVELGSIPPHNCWDPRTWTQPAGAIDASIARTLKADFGDAAVYNLKSDARVQRLVGYLTEGQEGGPNLNPLEVLNGGATGPWQKQASPINTYVYTLAGANKNSDQTLTFDARQGVTLLDSEQIRSTPGLADTIRESLQLDGAGNVTHPTDTAVAFGLPPMG